MGVKESERERKSMYDTVCVCEKVRETVRECQ